VSSPRSLIAAFWEALYARDWTAMREFFTEESVYYDVPIGPAFAGRGPDSIEARLRLGLETLTAYEHRPGTVVADEETVITEHEEVWHWEGGETVTLPFVSVHHVRDDKIAVWKDYWDLKTLMDAAPRSWHDRLDHADLSWVFDATGVV